MALSGNGGKMGKDKEKKPEEKQRYEVVQVATQTEDVIVDNEGKKTYSVIDFMAKLGNDINEVIKKFG